MSNETTMTQIKTMDSGSRKRFFFDGSGSGLGGETRSV
jgi:hypothetical protein